MPPCSETQMLASPCSCVHDFSSYGVVESTVTSNVSHVNAVRQAYCASISARQSGPHTHSASAHASPHSADEVSSGTPHSANRSQYPAQIRRASSSSVATSRSEQASPTRSHEASTLAAIPLMLVDHRVREVCVGTATLHHEGETRRVRQRGIRIKRVDQIGRASCRERG